MNQQPLTAEQISKFVEQASDQDRPYLQDLFTLINLPETEFWNSRGQFGNLTRREQLIIDCARAMPDELRERLNKALDAVVPLPDVPEPTPAAAPMDDDDGTDWYDETLDVAEQMSLHIIGSLALRGMWLRRQLRGDGGQGLHYLFTDIASAIRKAMPSLDWREFKDMHNGEL